MPRRMVWPGLRKIGVGFLPMPTPGGVPVLIMDDEPLAREAMTATLSDLGAHVRACANGEDVAAALDQGFAPRLLLMDLRINGELQERPWRLHFSIGHAF